MMKTSFILLAIFAIVPLLCTPALANPATLPEHPGYPMDKALDPVNGQSLANDPGQSNATGGKALIEASASEDTHVMQSLSDNRNEQAIREKSGSSRGQGSEVAPGSTNPGAHTSSGASPSPGISTLGGGPEESGVGTNAGPR
jgi:hypothetical protein